MPTTLKHIGFDYIVSMIKPQSKVLDLGCGNGSLLKMLKDEKQVFGTGIDIYEENIIECIKRGIPAVNADIDAGLKEYKDKSYDYVILSQTIQVVYNPLLVLKEMVRVGKTGIISFPNFAYWKIRKELLLKGKMPVNEALPYEWHDTPNIHLAAIKDVEDLCFKNSIKINEMILLSQKNGKLKEISKFFYNLFAQECIMVIEQG